MTRTRRVERDLTESWDDVEDYADEEEETEDTYRPTRLSASTMSEQAAARRRSLRSSMEPELIMPLSPTATTGKKQRTSPPHFRHIERSSTSDAGQMRQQVRTSTPRFRMNQRSFTSDAGRLRGSQLAEMVDEAQDEKDISGPGLVWQRLLYPFLAYLTDVVSLAARYAKPLLGWALLLYILVAAFIFASGFVTNTVNNALSPVCRLPFTSGLSFCPATKVNEVSGPAEFDQLMQAQDAFQGILENTVVGVNLPIGMKHSEGAIRDLKNVVKYSKLPSRNELVFEFEGFVTTAQQASLDMSKFNAGIGKSVDRILSTNRWTLGVIEGVNERDAAQGALSRWVNDNVNIFKPFQPVSLSQDVLLDQYFRHTSVVEGQIAGLIAQAIALRDVLDNLEGRLDLIHEIAIRDGVTVKDQKDELFATLWTKLGGNKTSVSRLEQQLELLRHVTKYKRAAWGHVTTTLVKLQDIQNSLQDLRERVSMPRAVGVDQLPLEAHIDSINRGIDRLQQQRDGSRGIEAERNRKLFSDDAGDARMIGSKEL